MLDVIKTKQVCGQIVSILLYEIDKCNREFEDNHNHYYEIRVSHGNGFYTDSEYYTKRSAIFTFNQVCREIVKEAEDIVKARLYKQKSSKILGCTLG